MPGAVRVGLVGASAGGGWASVAHVPGLQAASGIELAAVCTSGPESAVAASEAFGVPGYHDVAELAARDDIDVVSVVVRVPSHREAVMAALDAGKPVFSEWPLGANLDEASDMAARAKEVNVATGVGLQGRHDPHLRYLQQLHTDGWLGRIVSVNVTMFGGRALGHTSRDAWMGDKANGANFLTIVGGHIIDTLSYCVAPLAEFSSTVTTQFPQWQLTDTGETIEVDAPDSVVIEGELADGAALSLHAASVPHNASGWRMEIYGTDATIVATTSGLPQITPVELHGARGASPLEPLTLPGEFVDQLPSGPAGNVGRAYQGLAAALSQGQSFAPSFVDAHSLHRVIDSL